MMKQSKMEQLIMENRVRKLQMEDERLNKQIRIAQKHSDFADSVRQRKEEDIRQKEHAKEMERQRIELQHMKNEFAKTTTVT